MNPDDEPQEPIPIDPPDNTRTGGNAAEPDPDDEAIDPPDNT